MRREGRVAMRAAWGAALGVWAVAQSWDASSLASHRWAAVGGVLAVVWVALATPSLQRRLPVPGAVPGLTGAALFAIYCCVPETDQVPQVAAAVAVACAIELAIRRPLPWWVATALFALVIWSGLFGATGRESALVGTLFAAWPLVLPCLLPRLSAGRAVQRDSAGVAVAAVGVVAAVAVARTGALQPTVRPALVAVLVASAASVAVAALVSTRASAPADPDHDVG